MTEHSINVLITGANRGIGLEFVRQFVNCPDRSLVLSLGQRGNDPKNLPVVQGDNKTQSQAVVVVNVIATCRNPAEAVKLQELAERAKAQATQEYTAHVHIRRLDLCDDESIRTLAEEVKSSDQFPVLDLLVNNAGINDAQDRTLEGATREMLLRVVDTNAGGPLSICQSFISSMRQRSKETAEEGIWPTSRILNVSSMMGSIGDTTSTFCPIYRCSKATMNMVTKLYAVDFGPRGVCVTSFHPGHVATDMGGENAPVTPEQSVTGMLQTLASSDMERANGAFFNFDGTAIAF